ncbi:MAG TPA: hypothetical protein DFI00_09980 [Rhodospirillaceae bacterium]|nr:hypothetical protein [Rhodospirillaceae bacterium]
MTKPATSRFARFLKQGGIEASPTDGSNDSPAKRPLGRAIGTLATIGLLAGAMVMTPGSRDTASAHALATAPVAAEQTIQDEAKSRYQQHLERGIEMTWFRSGTRPMTTVLYFDRNRMSMGVERHGGIDRPAEAEGAPEFSQFMQIKQLQYQIGMHQALAFSEQTLAKVPGYNEPKADDGSDMGDMKAQIAAIKNPTEPLTVVQASQRVDGIVQSAIALATYHGIELAPETAEQQKQNTRELQINAVIMNMAVNGRMSNEVADAEQRVRYLQHMLTPPPSENPQSPTYEVSMPGKDRTAPAPTRRSVTL